MIKKTMVGAKLKEVIKSWKGSRLFFHLQVLGLLAVLCLELVCLYWIINLVAKIW